MENYISYVAGGEKQTVTTPLCFEDGIADYVIARKVLVAILGDLKNKIYHRNFLIFSAKQTGTDNTSAQIPLLKKHYEITEFSIL